MKTRKKLKSVKRKRFCVFKDRRPVTFIQDDEPKRERQNLLEAIQVSFSDLLSCGEGPSSLSPSYSLQHESERWGLIDVTGYIEDGGTVHLCFSTQGGGDVSVGMDYYVVIVFPLPPQLKLILTQFSVYTPIVTANAIYAVTELPPGKNRLQGRSQGGAQGAFAPPPFSQNHVIFIISYRINTSTKLLQ